jgi:4-amino-4-deoxy-L-arabinose transferase-like glycosyltransferase
MKIRKERAILIIIFVLALLLRLYCAFQYDESVRLLQNNDQLTYIHFAESLLHHNTFARADGQPTAYITPLYPLFLSVIYFFFGVNHLYVRIAHALLGSIVCLLIYFIAKEVFSRSVARLAFFFMSIHWFFISYGGHLLSENLFIFWVALSTLYLIKFCKKPAYLYAALFGLFSSLGTLTRSAYFLFPFMVIAILWFVPNLVNIAKRKLLKFSIVAVLCLVFPVSIWTIRNFCLFKSFIPLGTEAGIVLYAAYNPPGGKILDSSPDGELEGRTPEMSEIEDCRFLLKQTFLSIKKEPSKIYKYIPLKLMYFFSVFDWLTFERDVDDQGVYNLSTGFILPLSFMGIILIFRKKYSYFNLLPLLPVIYFLLITIAIMGVPRTRLPVEPYLIIYAAFFVNYMYIKNRSKLMTVGIFGLWYFLNYALYINSDRAKAAGRMFFERIGLW